MNRRQIKTIKKAIADLQFIRFLTNGDDLAEVAKKQANEIADNLAGLLEGEQYNNKAVDNMYCQCVNPLFYSALETDCLRCKKTLRGGE